MLRLRDNTKEKAGYPELIILAAALLFRFLLNYDLPILLARDSFAYLEFGRSFVVSHDFITFLPHRTPGYSLILQLIFWFLPDSGVVLNVVNSSFSIIAAYLLYLVIRQRFSRALARLGLAVLLFQPSSLVLENVLLTEVTTHFVLVVLVFLLHRVNARTYKRSFMVIGLLSSLSIFIRPDTAVFVVVLIMSFIFLNFGTKVHKQVTALAAWAVGFSLIVLWIIFVGRTTGVWSLTAAPKAARFEGMVYANLVKEGFNKSALGKSEVAALDFTDPYSHYKNYDHVVSNFSEDSKGAVFDPHVYKKVETFYSDLSREIISKSPRAYYFAIFYALLVNIGMGNPEQSDMQVYYQLLNTNEKRHRLQLCDIYGSVRPLFSKNIGCIQGLSAEPRLKGEGNFGRIASRVLSPIHTVLNGILGMSLIFSLIMLPFACLRVVQRNKVDKLLLALIVALFANAIVHAFFLALSHRYFEVVSPLFILISLGTYTLFDQIKNPKDGADVIFE